MGKGKKRTKGRAIRTAALCFLAAVVLAGGGLAWRFRAEIKAFAVSRQYSSAELEEQLADNDETIRSAVDASPDVTVRPPTEEERQALREGSLTQDELVGRLTGESSASDTDSTGTAGNAAVTPSQTAQSNTGSSGTKPDPADAAYQEKLSQLIAKVYVLREEYVTALDNLEAAAKADYSALPKAQRTNAKLASMVSDYLARGTELEKQCDSKMHAIVAEMEDLISENNGDMTLADTVFNTYINEKSLKKAWYMSRLQEKGLI